MFLGQKMKINTENSLFFKVVWHDLILSVFQILTSCKNALNS